MNYATARKLRSTDRTLARPAGALLPIRLSATTPDFATSLSLVRSLTRSGLLGHHDLVDQRHIYLNAKDSSGSSASPVFLPSMSSTLAVVISASPPWPAGPWPRCVRAPDHPWAQVALP